MRQFRVHVFFVDQTLDLTDVSLEYNSVINYKSRSFTLCGRFKLLWDLFMRYIHMYIRVVCRLQKWASNH